MKITYLVTILLSVMSSGVVARRPQPACGGSGQLCCGRQNTCNDGLSCLRNRCQTLPCGNENDNCCAGRNKCKNTLIYSSGKCVKKCGSEGRPCCARKKCDTGLECGATSKTCDKPAEPCGGSHQKCCPPDDHCNAPMVCIDDSVGRFCSCGGYTSPCCDGNTCNSPSLTCDLLTMTCQQA